MNNNSALGVEAMLLTIAEAINAYNSTEMKNTTYPVGTLYMNRTDSANPSVLLNMPWSTWVAVEDKMIMGRGSTYSADGGAATHTHTLGAGRADIAAEGTKHRMRRVAEGFTTTATFTASGGVSEAIASSYKTLLSGSTDAGSTIPPMIVAYIWERTA